MYSMAVRQDKLDDVRAGIKSTALLFGSRTKECLAGFAAANIGLLCLTGTRHPVCGALAEAVPLW